MAPARIGRRVFLALSATSLLHGQSGKGATLTFAPQHFLDPATELDLFRITDPQSNAWLPGPQLHFISRRGRFLIHTSDRSGTVQLYRLDWHTGQARQLTNATALDRSTPALSLDDRSVFYFDGPNLKQSNLSNQRERTVASVASGWERTPGFSLSPDGGLAVWVERQGGRSRLQLAHTAAGGTQSVIEEAEDINDPQLRPNARQVSYRLEGGVRLVNLDGRGAVAVKTSPGETIGQALWSPNGQSLIYLASSAERSQSVSLREVLVDQGVDRLVSKTSQFGSFGINGDSSVFVGASRSLASPYILLLLRSVRRELTLCEHRSSNIELVTPVFSPDSQSVFFTSDRKGKRCIYRAHVEKFVEETGEEPAQTE